MGVFFNANKYSSKYSKTIRVETNDRSHPVETLSCSGEFLQSLKFSPNVAQFGRFPGKGPPQNKSITILRGDGGPIDPEVVTTRLPGLDARICEVVQGEEYELVVSLDSPMPEGRFRDWVHLSTGVVEEPRTKVHVSGFVVSD